MADYQNIVDKGNPQIVEIMSYANVPRPLVQAWFQAEASVSNRGWDFSQGNTKYLFGKYQILIDLSQIKDSLGLKTNCPSLSAECRGIICDKSRASLWGHILTVPSTAFLAGLETTGWLTAPGCAFRYEIPTKKKEKEEQWVVFFLHVYDY